MSRLPIIDEHGGVLVCTATREERLRVDEQEPVHFVQPEHAGWVAE